MFESSLEMWNFQMGSKLWDAQPISSMQSLKYIKILEIDLARTVFFMFELSRTKMATVVPSWHGGAQ